MSAGSYALADILITGLIEYSLAMQEFNRIQQVAIAEGRDLNAAEIEHVKSYLGIARDSFEIEILRREKIEAGNNV